MPARLTVRAFPAIPARRPSPRPLRRPARAATRVRRLPRLPRLRRPARERLVEPLIADQSPAIPAAAPGRRLATATAPARRKAATPALGAWRLARQPTGTASAATAAVRHRPAWATGLARRLQLALDQWPRLAAPIAVRLRDMPAIPAAARRCPHPPAASHPRARRIAAASPATAVAALPRLASSGKPISPSRGGHLKTQACRRTRPCATPLRRGKGRQRLLPSDARPNSSRWSISTVTKKRSSGL